MIDSLHFCWMIVNDFLQHTTTCKHRELDIVYSYSKIMSQVPFIHLNSFELDDLPISESVVYLSRLWLR